VFVATMQSASDEEEKEPDWSDWELEIYINGENNQQLEVDSSSQTITFEIECERYDRNGIEDNEYYPTDTIGGFDINVSCSNGGTTSHSLINYNNLSSTTLTVTIPAFDENSDAYVPNQGVCVYTLSVDNNVSNSVIGYTQDSVTITQRSV
jgi:hypothetical protein